MAELAELLVERHEDWSDEDLAPDQGDDPHYEVIVMPQAWQRVQAEKRREIAALVKDGTLQGKGKGKSLRVELGPFYDWLGEPVPVEPAWAKAYDGRPDSDDEVKADRFGRARAWKARWSSVNVNMENASSSGCRGGANLRHHGFLVRSKRLFDFLEPRRANATAMPWGGTRRRGRNRGPKTGPMTR